MRSELDILRDLCLLQKQQLQSLADKMAYEHPDREKVEFDRVSMIIELEDELKALKGEDREEKHKEARKREPNVDDELEMSRAEFRQEVRKDNPEWAAQIERITPPQEDPWEKLEKIAASRWEITSGDPTEAWVISWKRNTGPVLAKSSTSGISDVDLFLTEEEAHNWCEVLKAQDEIHTPNQNLRGIREVRKVLVTFVEEE